MVEWVSLRTGARPVPEPVSTTLVWSAAFAGSLLLVAAVNALIGPGRPALALAVLSLLASLLGWCARFAAAPGTAVLCWLFLNGFAIPPAGTLSWSGQRDTFWLTCLLTAALTGTTLSRLGHARAAYRRVAAPSGTATGDSAGETHHG
ncbi:hypothetical protein [Streptomyces sp. NPDC057253]|uniref:hypothetical protein n=1 Tax=Streptomyces sp. NPDC057253 TaxID=3346069 RepID=UPI003642483F